MRINWPWSPVLRVVTLCFQGPVNCARIMSGTDSGCLVALQYLALSEVIRVAEELGGRNHGFRYIQLPVSDVAATGNGTCETYFPYLELEWTDCGRWSWMSTYIGCIHWVVVRLAPSLHDWLRHRIMHECLAGWPKFSGQQNHAGFRIFENGSILGDESASWGLHRICVNRKARPHWLANRCGSLLQTRSILHGMLLGGAVRYSIWMCSLIHADQHGNAWSLESTVARGEWKEQKSNGSCCGAGRWGVCIWAFAGGEHDVCLPSSKVQNTKENTRFEMTHALACI